MQTPILGDACIAKLSHTVSGRFEFPKELNQDEVGLQFKADRSSVGADRGCATDSRGKTKVQCVRLHQSVT